MVYYYFYCITCIYFSLQLEVEQIKKKAALLEEEKNRTLLEKAKIELEELKLSIIAKQSS